MHRYLLSLLLVVAACSQTEVAPTTSATVPPALVITTTTVPPLEVQLQSCSAPPITFSALCESYHLIQTWHVDRPVDDTVLLTAALEGLAQFETDATEPRPRQLLCAVPVGAFSELCEAVADRIDETLIPVGAAMDAAITSMVAVGLDPFSYYIPPDQVGSFRSNGVVGGIGALLDATDVVGSRCVQIAPNCRLEVVFVLEENAGAAGGLEPGDVITAVDGTPVEGHRFVEVVGQIAGDETGRLTLTIERQGATIDLSFDRQTVTVPSVEAEVLGAGVGYLRIPDFEADIPELVANAVAALDSAGVSTVVIDLRDNPGGFVDSALSAISEFVAGGTIMHTVEPSEESDFTAEGGARLTSQRLVVLVNSGTASAAEIMAAALRDRRSATVIGSSTFGKDAIQVPFELRNGGELYVVVARWLSPDLDSVGNGGLVPDVEANLPQELDLPDLIEQAMALAR